MNVLRLFIAVELDEKVKKEINEIVKRMKKDFENCVKIKWVERKNYHITLKFLGNVFEKDISEIIDKMNLCFQDEKAFTCEFDSLEKFPEKGRYVKLIYVKIKNEHKIKKLNKKLDDRLNEIGFPREKRYIPHMTLGRVKYIINKNEFMKKLQEQFKINEKINIKFSINNITLYESKLKPTGPEYVKLHQIKFK